MKQGFLSDIKNIVSLKEIPPDLINNWDQTSINYVPIGSWMMQKEGVGKEGVGRVELAGKDGNCQLTAVFAGSMMGDFLPPCSKFQGESDKSPIDKRTSVVKPLGAEWMKTLFDYFKGNLRLSVMASRKSKLI